MTTSMRSLLLGLTVAALGLSLSAGAVDVDAARALARQNNCFSCHGTDKKIVGPAWKDVATKYRGNPDAEAKLINHLNSGEKVKLPNGLEEAHMIIKTTNAEETKNLVDWILSLE